ncbi:hypothetical protein [Faecalicatena faecalis]|nr:hypothetical protein [Faecalicatena faecalis]
MKGGRPSSPAEGLTAGLDLNLDFLNEKRTLIGATWTRHVKF